ncbi:MAG: hypothetical protein ACFB13_01355 [Kiloniellaceae bacterium]
MMDVFEIAASFDQIAHFGSYEVITRWEDWYQGPDPGFYAEPVFSPEEALSKGRFRCLRNVAGSPSTKNSSKTQ